MLSFFYASTLSQVGHACSSDTLSAHWAALKEKGVIPRENEKDDYRATSGHNPKVRNKVAEGGTDMREFLEEGNLIHEALRLRHHSGAHFNVCQTGFNAGVSALAWLCNTPQSVLVHSFDLGEHDYVHTARDILDKEYIGRHRLVLGSSLETLPAEERGSLKCDFVFVDGGHTTEIASSDIFWFGRMSRPGTPIVVDNCNVFGRSARGSYGGTPTVNAAYIAAIGMGGNVSHVKQVSTGPCHDTSRGHLCRELCVGEYIRAGRE